MSNYTPSPESIERPPSDPHTSVPVVWSTPKAGALQRIRDLFEANMLDAGEIITDDVFEEVRDALNSTLINGEEVVSPTAEWAVGERSRHVHVLGYTLRHDDAQPLALIRAAMAHGLAAITPTAYRITAPMNYPWANWRERTREEHLRIATALMAAAGDVEARR